MRPWLGILFGAALVAAPLHAAEIKVLTTGAFKPVVVALAQNFEQQTGHRVTIVNDTAGGVLRRVEAGEAFDVLVLTPSAMPELAAKGKVAAGTAIDLARVAIGVAVKPGLAKPDISTVEAFKRMLSEAPSIAYIDPASGGSSGVYLAKLFERFGLADMVKGKAVLVPGGLVAERLLDGQAVIAIHQISELLAVPGVTFVGPLPAEIQNYTVYTGAISVSAKDPAPANALLQRFAGEDGVKILRDKGMEPPRS